MSEYIKGFNGETFLSHLQEAISNDKVWPGQHYAAMTASKRLTLAIYNPFAPAAAFTLSLFEGFFSLWQISALFKDFQLDWDQHWLLSIFFLSQPFLCALCLCHAGRTHDLSTQKEDWGLSRYASAKISHAFLCLSFSSGVLLGLRSLLKSLPYGTVWNSRSALSSFFFSFYQLSMTFIIFSLSLHVLGGFWQFHEYQILNNVVYCSSWDAEVFGDGLVSCTDLVFGDKSTCDALRQLFCLHRCKGTRDEVSHHWLIQVLWAAPDKLLWEIFKI